MCGGKAHEVDHLLPMAWGGSERDPANLRSMCRDCHRSKTNEEKRLGKVLKSLEPKARQRQIEQFLAKWRVV